ncbi:hypothetical protein OG607_41735 [Streptomyces sp. NBC_01537]|uniref:restriction endonuclease fold toxin-2 domain-containing protein n=1 Tax=Streptomyces sp. NBC_01537 TaxID=2903896 RepID=UPI00386BD132
MGYRVEMVNLVESSWGMLRLRDLIFDMLSALVAELSEQHAMAGDDDAGQTFASVYTESSRTVVDQLNYASVVMSSGAKGLLDTAQNYMAAESAAAAQLLGDTSDTGVAAQPSNEDCSPRPSHHGEDLPEVVGETSGVDQFVFGDRYRGNPGKVRTVSTTWRKAAGVVEIAFHEAKDHWRRANLGHEGVAADGIEDYFKRFVGKGDPPGQPQEDEPLLPNLYASCRALSAACEKYADHIDTALRQIPKDENPLTGEFLWPWEKAELGGNGYDGGLSDLVAGDSTILRLANVPHALDSSQARIKVPQQDNGSAGTTVPPFLGPIIRVPIMVPAGYTVPNPNIRYKQPVAPPVPPDPRFPPLSAPDSKRFSTWLDSLTDGGYSGGLPEDKDYQYRVAGYPEKEVPLPAGLSKNNTLMVDGFRTTDGMAIEAKHVRNQRTCPRTIDAIRTSHLTGKKDFLYRDDREELGKYAAAMSDPRNKEMRGVEIDTDNQDSVAYWRAMMAAYGVKGYARYVP